MNTSVPPSPVASPVTVGQTPPAPNAPPNGNVVPPINTQVKRTTDDLSTPNAKRPRIDGPMTPGPLTPGSMGPPSAMGPPSVMQKKRDEGLDEGDPNDVFGGAGINLQDEERNMTAFEVPRRVGSLAQQQIQYAGEQARKSDFLDFPALQYLINRKLSESGLNKFDNEIHGLMGMALKERLTGLMTRMVVLSKHRCAPPPANGKPIDDVGRILRNISLKEAEDEERRRTIASARRAEEEAKRRAEEEASSASKRKPGSARTLTEQAIARNANATAQMMLNQSGGKKYSWMTGVPNTSQLPRRGTAVAGASISANVFKTATEEHGGQITLKDFINALELEGEDIIGRGGKALLRAYTQLKD